MVSRANEVVFACVIAGAVVAVALADADAPAGVPAGAFTLVAAVLPMVINNNADRTPVDD